MAEAKRIAEIRIVNFGFLLKQNPTPLLQEELYHAIKLHAEALDSPDIRQFIPDLNASHAQLGKHWARVYADMLTTASLSWDIYLFERFLRLKLLEDYVGEPYEVNDRMLSLAECTAKQDMRHLTGVTGEDNTTSDEEYREHVVFPLEESKLDRAHVERKLRAVAARRGCPGSDIQPLIDARDWAKLAAVLTSDQEIILKLTQRSVCPVGISEKILTGINRIQNKYFASLSGPSTFTLASTGYQTSPSPLHSFTSSVYDAIASGFKGNSPSSRAENRSDDRQLLLGEDVSAQSLPLVTKVNLKKME